MSLYDTDFAEWAHRNADLLRSKRLAEADLMNIAEEIEDLGNERRRALKSRVVQILEHLLKLRNASGELHRRDKNAWLGSIERQRGEIEALLEDSPSLRREMSERRWRSATTARPAPSRPRSRSLKSLPPDVRSNGRM